MNKFAYIATALLLLSGCQIIHEMTAPSEPAVDTRPLGPNGERLNRIPGTVPVQIPAGLSDKQAIDAVAQAVTGTGDNERNIAFVSQWRLESRDKQNKWIQIGLTVRSHYLCVCYRIENGALVPDVPTSRNLKQDGVKIHRKVPQWINNLAPLITQRLYRMANPQ